MLDVDHTFERREVPISQQGFAVKLLTNGYHPWIGMGTIITPGATIGEAAIVGANSFPNRDIPRYMIGGVPEPVIREHH